MEFQRNNSIRFPTLAILARYYLAIPATSATIKSTFSISNNIITKSRNRLLLNTVRQLILLKSWYKSYKDLNKEEEYLEEDKREEIKPI